MRVRPNQTLPDICMMAYGTLEPLGILAAANGIGITDDLVVGSKLTLPDLDRDARVLRAFREYGTIVAVGTTMQPIADDGYVVVDYWDDDYTV